MLGPDSQTARTTVVFTAESDWTGVSSEFTENDSTRFCCVFIQPKTVVFRLLRQVVVQWLPAVITLAHSPWSNLFFV
jgi:hypothetical protein